MNKPEQEQQEEQKPAGETRNGWQRLARFLLRLFLGIFGFFFLVFLLFQIPAVQNYVADRITRSLSEAWDTRVELDRVQLEFFDKFVLEGFYVEDQQQDTLIYAEHLKVNFRTGLVPLILRRLEIEEISLRHARVFIRRPKGAEESNIRFLLDRLAGEQADPVGAEKKPFHLNVENLFLDDVEFRRVDSLYGSDQRFYLFRMEVGFEEFAPEAGRIMLSDIKIEDPDVQMTLFPWDTTTVEAIQRRDSLAELTRWPPELSNNERHLLFPWDFLNYSDLSFVAWSMDWPPLDSLFAPAIPEKGLVIQANAFDLMGGTFVLDNYRNPALRVVPDNVLDFRHLDLSEIYINVRDFSLKDGAYQGDVRRIAFDSESGFVVKRLASANAFVDSRGIRLEELELVTPYSEIGDRVVLTYDAYTDFQDFVNAVELDSVQMENSSVAIRDIMAFAPALEENIYFQNNRDKVLQVDGNFFGTIDNLSGSELTILLDPNTYLNGEFSFYNLTLPENQYLNLRLNSSRTNFTTLRQLIPNFDAPPNFDRLGTLDFSGRFDGFFYNFVANGTLVSDIGRAVLDMQLNTIGGRQNALYAGNIQLINFDLGRWTNNEQLGKISMNSRVRNGKGLTAASAEANLTANIDSLGFRGYKYRNVNMGGELRQNLFDGQFTIQDNNIDLGFSGTIDFTERSPLIDFQADIGLLDLQALNLVEKDYAIAGQVDLNLRNIKPVDMEGRAILRDFVLTADEKNYYVDSVALISVIHSANDRELIVESDLLSGHVDGHFDITKVAAQFQAYSWKHFPRFSEELGIPQTDQVIDSTSAFSYEFHIRDTKGLMDLIDPRIEELSDVDITGSFVLPDESFKFDLEVPGFQFGTTRLEDVVVVVKARDGGSDLNLAVAETRIGENITLAPINLLGLVDQDTLFFGVTAYDFTDILNTVEVDGRFFPVEEDFIVRFEESDIILFNELWQIDANNFLRIGDNYVRTRDFVLRNGNRQILLESLGSRGLFFQLKYYDLASLNELLGFEPIDFAGQVQLRASVQDVFSLEGLEVTGVADTLLINGDDYGSMRLQVEAQNLKSRITADMEVARSGQHLHLDGYYNPPKYAAATRQDPANYLDVTGDIGGLPLAALEYFIATGISDTEGEVNAKARVFGPPEKPEIEGEAEVRNGAVTIDFLNTRYFIPGHTLELTSEMIEATGARVYDEMGNEARVVGGITHENLRDFQLAVRLNTERFLGLNTQKGQNDLFYGTAYANGSVDFTGPFNRTDIFVRATSLEGTRITLPVDYGSDASEVSFIRFTDKRNEGEETVDDGLQEEPLGASVVLDLDIRQNTEMRIVFDEQLGDVLSGRGNGALFLEARRNEEFKINGDIVVTQGNYLFTLMNIGVNKPFRVLPGGIIKWSGDPLAAEIDLTAAYENLQVKPENFIQEYLLTASEAVQRAANDPTAVDLKMNLSGQLLNPTINFDIAFPNLTGEMESYVDSKLRIIRQDQNEMNRQVFGLIVVGQFLPSDFSLSGSEFNIGFNTVTEMIFQQFSNYLTGLVSEWLREDGLITGIDFDINYSTMQDAEAIADNPILYYQSGELEFRLSNYLLNDRLSVNVGGNFDLGGNNFVDVGGTQGTYFAGDLVIEYELTDDRNLKIRFYQSTEPDLSGDRLNRTGIGLSYRKQFDSFSEFLQGLRGATKEMSEGKRKKKKKD